MGRNIFVSYKYSDTLVRDINKKDLKYINGQFQLFARKTRARDYVDELQKIIGEEHINLGEKDGESLANFSDSTIESVLKKKIYRSSVTIVLISKGMKESSKDEKDQWIPWEVSYSLRIVKREDSSSQMNAILGVVLPDENGSYSWYYTPNSECNCVTHHTSKLFKVLSNNMFNKKEQNFRECNNIKIHISDEPSFIKTIEWDTFINGNNYTFYVEKAVEIKNNKELYNDIIINF